MYESPYIKRRQEKHPDPIYIHELKILRAMVRQEDRQGDKGWGGTWTKERYQRLKDKHPEALMAFQSELRGEQEEKRLHQEFIRKHRRSPYIEEVEVWPDSDMKDSYLKDLRRLKHLMVLSRLGYGSPGMGYAFVRLRDRYPNAHGVFKKEIEEL